MLRSEVGKQAQVRFTPSLTFVLDGVQDNARRIDELIEKAHAADARVHEVAAGASPAGDPEPYRLRDSE